MNYVWHIVIACFLYSCSGNDHPVPTADVNPEDWIYNPQVSDEFDGESLDTSKWYDYNPTGWLGRQPSLFRRENVTVRNGELILSGRRENVPNAPEGYHTFTTAAVQSTRKVLYGFFEIRCRPMDSALSSAFWLYTSDSVKQEEIDIFEICGRHANQPSYDTTLYATSHFLVFDKLKISDHAIHTSKQRWADRTFVMGLKWTRDEIVWYVDGQEIRRRNNDYWHSPETINFDSEAFPEWWGLPDSTDNGGDFRIEYFRYWSESHPQGDNGVFPNNMVKP